MWHRTIEIALSVWGQQCTQTICDIMHTAIKHQQAHRGIGEELLHELKCLVETAEGNNSFGTTFYCFIVMPTIREMFLSQCCVG